MKILRKFVIFLAVYLLNYHAFSATYFVAPNGNDSNAGTISSPFATIQFAINKTVAGDIIYLRGGTYQIGVQINITPANNGTSTAPVKLWTYQNEKPILDFSLQKYASGLRGFLITADYWHIKGLEIANNDDNGIKLEGNNNTIETCVFHHCGDTGIQLGFGHTTNVNNPGNLCSNNLILNCDSYLNFDPAAKGGNADGFACKMHNGKNNIFKGCRAWENSDDGWDLFETDWLVQILNCWTWHSGDRALYEDVYLKKVGSKMSSFSGNGNGIKLGGNGVGGNSVGIHIAKNCVAFNNTKTTSVKGFDQNNHAGGVYISHCLAWNNGYNFMFETSATTGNSNTFINNVSIKGTRNDYEVVAGSIEQNNSWNLTTNTLANASDYINLTEEMAKAPRQADGSLPDNGFARLVNGSDLIDKGVVIANESFTGKAPDLGPYEFKSTITSIDFESENNNLHIYPNPFNDKFTIYQTGEFEYKIYDNNGLFIQQGHALDKVVLGEFFNSGLYLVKTLSNDKSNSYKVLKNK
jgi:pectate disaccharide-lyase